MAGSSSNRPEGEATPKHQLWNRVSRHRKNQIKVAGGVAVLVTLLAGAGDIWVYQPHEKRDAISAARNRASAIAEARGRSIGKLLGCTEGIFDKDFRTSDLPFTVTPKGDSTTEQIATPNAKDLHNFVFQVADPCMPNASIKYPNIETLHVTDSADRSADVVCDISTPNVDNTATWKEALVVITGPIKLSRECVDKTGVYPSGS